MYWNRKEIERVRKGAKQFIVRYSTFFWCHTFIMGNS